MKKQEVKKSIVTIKHIYKTEIKFIKLISYVVIGTLIASIIMKIIWSF